MTTKTIETDGDRIEQAAKISRLQAEAKTADARIEQALKWRDNRILFLQDQLAEQAAETASLKRQIASMQIEYQQQLDDMENDRDAQRQRADWYEQDEFKKATELAKLRSALKHSQNQHHDHGHAPDIDIVNGF